MYIRRIMRTASIFALHPAVKVGVGGRFGDCADAPDAGRGGAAVSGRAHIGIRSAIVREKGNDAETKESQDIGGQNEDVESPQVIATDTVGGQSINGRRWRQFRRFLT